MAYMSQQQKKLINANLKPILKKYGIKATLAVRNHSTLVLNIYSSPIDFISNFNDTCGKNVSMARFSPATSNCDVNPYWYKEHFSGVALNAVGEIVAVMNDGNHDNSDLMTDYFDVGWYVDVNIGKWNKPYEVTK